MEGTNRKALPECAVHVGQLSPWSWGLADKEVGDCSVFNKLDRGRTLVDGPWSTSVFSAMGLGCRLPLTSARQWLPALNQFAAGSRTLADQTDSVEDRVTAAVRRIYEHYGTNVSAYFELIKQSLEEGRTRTHADEIADKCIKSCETYHGEAKSGLPREPVQMHLRQR